MTNKDTVTLSDACEARTRQIIEEKEHLEMIAKEDAYLRLLEEKQKASSEHDFKILVQKFGTMNGYKNTTTLADECAKKMQQIIEERERLEAIIREEAYMQLLEQKQQVEAETITDSNIAEFHKLAKQLSKMNGYKGTKELSEECLNEARRRQSKLWESQCLCRYDGGKLSLFGKKCKFCRRKN